MDMKQILTMIALAISIIGCAQENSKSTIWKNYSEDVNNGYSIQFNYPSYFKFSRIENCMCLGHPLKSGEYDNTMDWGIWINEPSNYEELDISYFKNEFNNDFIIKKDTLIVSEHKALRTIVTQSHGNKYYENIVISYPNCILEITNKKCESKDFKKFYNSIIIKATNP
jgi:hypothetical protein